MRLGWKFTTTNDIPSNGKVIVEFAASINFTPKTTARCELKANKDVKQKAHTCAISYILGPVVSIVFSLSSLDGLSFPADTYTLFQYEVDVANINAVDIDFKIKTLTSTSTSIDVSQFNKLDMDETYTTPRVAL
jgi:hypothetical protein